MQSSLVLEQVPDLQILSSELSHQTPDEPAQLLEDSWAHEPFLLHTCAHVSAGQGAEQGQVGGVQHLAGPGGPQPTFPAGNGSSAENVTHPDESVTFLWSWGHPLKGRMSCIPGVSPALRP